MYSKRKTGHRRLKHKTRKNKSRKTRRGGTKRVKRHTRQRRVRMCGGTSHLMGAPYNAGDAQPQGNYYAYNSKVEAWPQQSNAGVSQNGGKKRGRKMLRGGGFNEFIDTLLPQDVVNFGRSLPAAAGHMYDRFNGALSSASSMVYPTQQPLAALASPDAGRMMKPADMLKMYNNNNNLVAKI